MLEMQDRSTLSTEKGVLASNRISSRFTWPLAAQKLVKIIAEYGEN